MESGSGVSGAGVADTMTTGAGDGEAVGAGVSAGGAASSRPDSRAAVSGSTRPVGGRPDRIWKACNAEASRLSDFASPADERMPDFTRADFTAAMSMGASGTGVPDGVAAGDGDGDDNANGVGVGAGVPGSGPGDPPITMSSSAGAGAAMAGLDARGVGAGVGAAAAMAGAMTGAMTGVGAGRFVHGPVRVRRPSSAARLGRVRGAGVASGGAATGSIDGAAANMAAPDSVRSVFESRTVPGATDARAASAPPSQSLAP